MDIFSIGGTLWRHKWVSIPVVLLTTLGMLYVLALQAPTYQAKADIFLTNPPVTPTAFQISQDPKLAKMNNPLANLGSLTYVAEVLINSVTAPAAKQELIHAGVSEYQVVLDNASLANIPPAIDVIGTGPNEQAATRSAQLVATAISSDLVRLQTSQHVQGKVMITAVEYVRPTSVTKSSGKLETAAGIAAIGLIALLVAVSMAQGRAEQKNRRSRHDRRSGYREDGRRDPANSEPELSDVESRRPDNMLRPDSMPRPDNMPRPHNAPRPDNGPRPAVPMAEPYPAGSGRGRSMQPNGGAPWGHNG